MSASISREVGVGALGEVARERLRALEQVLERTCRSRRAGRARRRRRGVDLIGAARRLRAGEAGQDLAATIARRIAGTGVDPDLLALFDEERHLDGDAGLERGRLGAAAGGGVALDAGLGLGDLELDEAGSLRPRRAPRRRTGSRPRRSRRPTASRRRSRSAGSRAARRSRCP